MLKLKNIYRINLLYIFIVFALSLCFAFGVQAKVTDSETKIVDEEITLKGSIGIDGKDVNYIYDPTGKTDPFKSFIATQQEKAEKKREKPRTELETLELSQLTLSVIVIGEKGKWAMVRDSKDKGHIIKRGTPIGTNGGVVYRIIPGEVIIREEFVDFKGKKQFKDVSKKTLSEK